MSSANLIQPATTLIPISFFEHVLDSGQIQSFAQSGEVKLPNNPLFVTREQQGQDFSENANFLHNEPIAWDELVRELERFAQEPYLSKEAAPLFAPTVFQTKMYFNGDGNPYRGFRCVHNATKSAMLALDADNK